jgi:hypothetical protein
MEKDVHSRYYIRYSKDDDALTIGKLHIQNIHEGVASFVDRLLLTYLPTMPPTYQKKNNADIKYLAIRSCHILIIIMFPNYRIFRR